MRGSDRVGGLNGLSGFVDCSGGEWVWYGGLAELLVDPDVGPDGGIDVYVSDLARWGFRATDDALIPSTGGCETCVGSNGC